MGIKKALITAAGYGTRFLPISKTVKKEMLPILNRPLMDYIVEGCVVAGIEEIIIVVREQETLIQNYYQENRSLLQHLDEMGKLEKYRHALNLDRQINFRFITQTHDDGYGSAIPVKIAEKYLRDESSFLVLMGDDFIYNHGADSEITNMINTFNTDSHALGLATCIVKPVEELFRYGVAKTKTNNGLEYLEQFVEKPAPGTAPSNRVNISKYILTPAIFEILENQKPNPQSNEYYITDTVNELVQRGPVLIHVPRGEYLDGGNIVNWLKANLTVAKDNAELWSEIKPFLRELL